MKCAEKVFSKIFVFSVVILGWTILSYKEWLPWEDQTAISMPVKPLPPLDVELMPQILSPKIGDIVPVDLVILPKMKIERLIVKLEKEGIVDLIIDDRSMELEKIEKDIERHIPIKIKIVDEGKGRLRADVFSLSQGGEVVFGRSSTLYFLSGPEEVLIGKDGFVNLEVERLKRNYRGKFPEPGTPEYEEYRRELDKILGGGAIETNKPSLEGE